MSRILITRPEHDPLTRHLSYWNSRIIELASGKGHTVTDLHKEKANKKEFEGRMKKLNPDLVLLNGHGDDISVTGHNNEVIVKEGENSNLLKNKITYAVACSSAKKLGEACADSRTTYIGYDEYFVLNLDRRCFSDPLRDERAGRFLDPSNKVALSLVKGHTAKQASENSKKAFRENIISLLTKGSPDVDSLDDAKDLYWNMTHQICLGNGEAKL
jgi:hypothetical protein